MKILIVDDEQNVAQAVGWMVKDAGWDYEICTDPEMAIKLAEEGTFGAIICDYTLFGGWNGFHVLKHAKCPRKALMSGQDTPETLAILKGYRFFLKPIRIEDIEEWLSPKYD